MKTMTYILNLTLLVVCTQFVFADNANEGGKQMYISFEDAQAALPDKDIYKPEHDNNTRSAPDWEDDPGAYEFTATMNALVLMDGNPIAEDGDILAAFDADGNVRGVSTEQSGIGPYDGEIIHEVIMRSNAAGDVLSFKYYDASEDEVLSSGASYTFVINDLAGTLIAPYELNVGTVTLSIELAGGWNMFSVNAIVDNMHPDVVLASLNPAVNDQIKNLSGSAVYYGEEYGWQGSLESMAPGQGFMLSVAVSSDLVYPNADGMARMSLSLEEAKVLPLTIASWEVDPHAYEFSGTIDMSIDSRTDFDGDWVGVFVGSECRGIAERMSFPIDGSDYYSVMVFSNVTEGEKLSFKYYSSLDDEIIEYAETEEFIANMNDHNGLNIFSLNRETGKFGQPTSYGLSKAYPNPFNPATSFEFTLEVDGMVELAVYDINGRMVAELANGYMSAGTYPVVWNANELSSGVYMVSMIAGDYSTLQKVMLIK